MSVIFNPGMTWLVPDPGLSLVPPQSVWVRQLAPSNPDGHAHKCP